jgi:uncharacterized membrane protein/protein-disulfide isomerase
MASKSTPWLTAFAALGLAAATWSTWVHYQILNSPTYESFCDVNSTLNCTAAYTSRFGAVGGVPVALFGLLFFAGVLLLIALCSQSKAAAPNLPGYVFATSTIGLAVVLYLAYASYFILHVVCLLCAGTYLAVIGLFLISGAATNVPLTSLPMRILDDLKLLVRTPRALTTTVVFIAAAAAAIVVFPEQRVTAAANPAEAEQTQAVPAASAAQIQQLEAWLAQQPRVTVMAPSDGAAVVILKFNDYQCPGCGQTYRDYKPVLAKWAKQAPGKVKFITKDYPLERQCNQFIGQDLHLGACEAAVAVRLAREKGKAEAMEEWLYSNQAAMVNPDSVKKAAASIGGVTDFDARFAGTLELVKADIAQASQLKVGGTPTFFMNGIQLPGLRGEFFDAAIAWELRRVSGGK